MPTTWSLITVTYNSAETLRRYWTAERPSHVEWIVVDNGSTDASVQIARQLGAVIIAADENLGFAAANNRGLLAASGEYIAFVNPDVLVGYDDLAVLTEAIDRTGGLVAPQLLNDDGSLQPNGRGAPFLADKILNRIRPIGNRGGYQLLAATDQARDVFWLIGAVIAGHANTIRDLGGWNERFFLYYEDKDIGLRAWAAGYPVTLLGAVHWVHGWSRETARLRLRPWMRELDSLVRFYSLYPEFLLTKRAVRKKHPVAAARSGSFNDDTSVTSPRTVAFYLPQFHTIPENDQWWGEGFTEWVNVRRARPLYVGHDHPCSARELGEYDLSDVDVMHKQAAMATANGVDAFCFYFYWFDGRRLLERPVDQYLEKGPNFPFCISWANESWSRRWDGKAHEHLITQEYGPSTPQDVFASFLPYLRDPRYLRVDGAAVILVHRADHLSDGASFASTWRRLAQEHGIGRLHLVATETHPGITPGPIGFDAVAEFPPVGSNTLSTALLRPVPGLSRSFRGRLMSYPRLARRYMRRSAPPYTRHRGVAPGWDNTARRGNAATVYVDAHPRQYREWLQFARADETRLRGDGGLVFVNAWNEWAEGAHLEPDTTNECGYLLATRWRAEVLDRRERKRPRGSVSWPWIRSLSLATAGSALSAGRRLSGRLGLPHR